MGKNENGDANEKNLESVLKKRLTYEKMISDMAAKAVSVDDVREFLTTSVEIMGKAFNVSHVSIFEYHRDKHIMRNTYEWASLDMPSKKSGLRKIPLDDFPWWFETMVRKQMINCKNIEDLPGDREKELLRSHQIKSILALPLFSKSAFFGFLCFDECRFYREWMTEDVNILYTAALVIVGFIERKQAENEVREFANKHKLLLDHCESSILYFNPKGEVLLANKRASLDFKKTMESLTGSSLYQLFSKPKADFYLKKFRKVMHENKEIEFEEMVPFPIGEQWRLTKVCPVKDVNGEISGILVISTNTHKIRLMEETLRESEERYELIALHTTDVIWKVDTDLNVQYISPSIYKLTGFPEHDYLGRSLEEMVTQPSATMARKTIEDKLVQANSSSSDIPSPTVLELEFTCKEGAAIWTESTLSAYYDKVTGKLGGLGVSRDISAQKKSEEEKIKLLTQLRRAQKMETIGALAGGIAHDFNNILYPIVGYTEMTMEDLPENSIVRANLQEVLKAAARAGELIQQILVFSRQNDQELLPMMIRPVIKEVMKLLRSSVPSNILFSLDIDNECGRVMADPIRIRQVMMNLCANAYHSMSEKGGELTVSLTEVYLGSDATSKYGALEPGPYVKITIKDTGHGIAPEIMERIFDPYFTTKELGMGTGMGLPVVHGIIKSHNGHIHVESKPGEGSVFEVYLPRVEPAPKEMAPLPAKDFPSEKARILLVDDEEQIIGMVQQMLERLGYKVTARTSSLEALEAFRAHPQNFDLVITDMTMPNMTGDLLAQELLRIRRDIPILLCTGFGDIMTDERMKAAGIKHCIMKPVIKNQMAAAIHTAISYREDDSTE